MILPPVRCGSGDVMAVGNGPAESGASGIKCGRKLPGGAKNGPARYRMIPNTVPELRFITKMINLTLILFVVWL